MIVSYMKTKTAGLANLGNTCFMNTCLQIMAHSFELNDLLQKYSLSSSSSVKSTTLWTEWRQLMMEMWKRHPEDVVIQPRRFVYWVQKIAEGDSAWSLFSGWNQHDFSEFLHFFLSHLHKAVATPMEVVIRGQVVSENDSKALEVYTFLQKEYAKEYSEVDALFHGVYLSILKNDTGHIVSSKPEKYMTLDLAIKPTLQESLTDFVSEERLHGDNAWFNEATGKKETVSKSIRLWNIPTLLVICLKRFHDAQRKNTQLCTFTHVLDMANYMVNPKQSIYDLYSVACHIGQIQGGHYYAYVKNEFTNSWFLCNDSNITPVGNPQEMIGPAAYCLFYRRRK